MPVSVLIDSHQRRLFRHKYPLVKAVYKHRFDIKVSGNQTKNLLDNDCGHLTFQISDKLMCHFIRCEAV